jgi:hypothetical protein
VTVYHYGESLERKTTDRYAFGPCVVVFHEVARTSHSYRLRIHTACNLRFEADYNSNDEAYSDVKDETPMCVACIAALATDNHPPRPLLGSKAFMRYRP